MTKHPTIDLKALRQIGWDLWDPIGIRKMDDQAWQNAAADEYDTYLLHAATMIVDGATPDMAAAYLDRIIVEHMCLTPARGGARDSSRTAEAIAAYILRGSSSEFAGRE